ncbi:hypothetical protein ZWY2020_052791 [Hordeum vulgare]|nr:hypothetical protein ZWY2020_052791 [Hordeum vulgare]
MAIKKPSKTDKKHSYDQKLCQLLDEYSRVLVAAADNVGSTQLAEIRRGIRGDSVMLMGKNTLIRRCITAHALRTGNENTKAIIPLLQETSVPSFTKGDLKEVREEIAKYKVGAPARVGLVVLLMWWFPWKHWSGSSQTSFFQLINIPTKINKGSVEIVAHVDLIKKAPRFWTSPRRPDGEVRGGVSMVASLSLAVSHLTLAAAPHMFLDGYKNVLAVAVETEYSFPHADQIKEYLKDPSKFAVAAVPGGGAARCSCS